MPVMPFPILSFIDPTATVPLTALGLVSASLGLIITVIKMSAKERAEDRAERAADRAVRELEAKAKSELSNSVQHMTDAYKDVVERLIDDGSSDPPRPTRARKTAS